MLLANPALTSTVIRVMNPTIPRASDRADAFRLLFASKIVVLDGAMGSMIQTFKLSEADFRGEQFKSHPHDLQGNNDLLALTRPDIIEKIHRDYFAAGAGMGEKKNFNSNPISPNHFPFEALG